MKTPPSKKKKSSPVIAEETSRSAHAADPRALLVGFSDPRESLDSQGLSPEVTQSSFQSNLLSLLSHEVRTPLMGILNGILLLEMERPPKVRTEGERIALEQIQRNSERLKSLIQSLLDLAVIDAHAVRPQLDEIDLPTWLRSQFSPHVPVSAAQEGIKVLADPEKLRRALHLIIQVLSRRNPAELEFRIQENTHPSLILSFRSSSSEIAAQVEHAFREGALLVSTGTLDPAQALRFAQGTEAEFLRQEDDASPLSLDLPWALALHALAIQEIQAEILADSGAPSARLLLFSFPARASHYRLESLLHSRILALEGAHGSAGELWIAWTHVELPGSAQEHLRNADVLEPGDAVVLAEEQGRLLLLLENPSEHRRAAALELLKRVPGMQAVGISTYPHDAADARTLLELARESAALNDAHS